MPVTKSLVKKLIDRLCTLPSSGNHMFDSDAQAKIAVRAEIGRAIERCCGNDSHAERTVENLMAGRFRPSPGEIGEAAVATPHKQELPEHCEICQGEPWVSVERIQMTDLVGRRDETGRNVSLPVSFHGAKRCVCARGQWFRQKDRENEAKRAAGLPV